MKMLDKELPVTQPVAEPGRSQIIMLIDQVINNKDVMSELKRLQSEINQRIFEAKEAEKLAEERKNRLAETLHKAQEILEKLEKRMHQTDEQKSKDSVEDNSSSETQSPQGESSSERAQDLIKGIAKVKSVVIIRAGDTQEDIDVEASSQDSMVNSQVDGNSNSEISNPASVSQASTSQNSVDESQEDVADDGASQVSQKSTDVRQWLREVRPVKSPYIPQLQDEIVYFKQGHEEYLKTVEEENLYEIDDSKDKPWTYMKIHTPEFVRVKSISYEYPELSLCELELERLEGFKDGSNKDSFTIRYRDVDGVVDFLILRQLYDKSSKRDWSASDKFKCAIGDEWMFGMVVNVDCPFQKQHPMSPFRRILVKWDGAKLDEKVSHWEIEPVDEASLSNNKKDKVSVLPEEKLFVYKPKSTEWPSEDRESTYQKILKIIEQIKQEKDQFYGEPIFELGSDKSYLEETAYPIDLSIVKARLEHKFYRRFSALKFDVDYLNENIKCIKRGSIKLKTTAKKNIDELPILSKLVCEMINKVEQGAQEVDIVNLYNKLVESLSSTQETTNSQCSFQPDSMDLSQESDLEEAISRSTQRRQWSSLDWLEACKILIRDMFQDKDSAPFRCNNNNDYGKLNLFEIQQYLETGEYTTPRRVLKELDSIFEPRKNLNENSKLYKQIEKMKAIYTEPMEQIIESWETSRKKSSPSKKSPLKRQVDLTENGEVELTSKRQKLNYNEAGPSRSPRPSRPRRKPKRRFSTYLHKNSSDTTESESSDDEDENEDDDDGSESNDEYDNKSDDDDNDDDDDNMDGQESGSRKRNSQKKNHMDDESDEPSDGNESTCAGEDSDGSECSSFESFCSRVTEEVAQKSSSKTSKKKKLKKQTDEQLPLPVNIQYTPDDVLNKIGRGIVPKIVGVICERQYSDNLYSKKTGAFYELLQFKVKCAAGTKVHVKAWETIGGHYKDYIKKNDEIIEITNLYPKCNEYNQGDIAFELDIKEDSEVSLISPETGIRRKIPKYPY